VIVEGGHRAVIWDRLAGVKEGVVKDEGSFLLIPFWQRGIIFDVRTTPKLIDTETGSKGSPESGDSAS
jgi:prohibitin 1